MNPMLAAIQRRLGGGNGQPPETNSAFNQPGGPRGHLPFGLQGSQGPAQDTLSTFADAIKRRFGG